jgi:purine-binding chemotaxis protein CheW
MLASTESESTPTTVDEQLTSTADAPRLLLFGVGGRLCACELDAIREIVPFRHATRLPGAPPFVTGLINLRGSILTVMDLGLRLGSSPIDAMRGSIVLAESGGKVIGLGVDELRDVQRVARAQIEPADGEIGSGLVSGVLRVGEDVAMLLDVRAIIKQIFGGNL